MGWIEKQYDELTAARQAAENARQAAERAERAFLLSRTAAVFAHLNHLAPDLFLAEWLERMYAPPSDSVFTEIDRERQKVMIMLVAPALTEGRSCRVFCFVISTELFFEDNLPAVGITREELEGYIYKGKPA